MTQETAAAKALAAYDDLYKNPRTGEYIIDGDEAQVAADLAEIVRASLARQEQAAEQARVLVRGILDEFKGEDEEISLFVTRFVEEYPETPRHALELFADNIKQVTRTSELQSRDMIAPEGDHPAAEVALLGEFPQQWSPEWATESATPEQVHLVDTVTRTLVEFTQSLAPSEEPRERMTFGGWALRLIHEVRGTQGKVGA